MTTIPTRVTFQGLKPNDIIKADIREHAAWLSQYYARITRCRVLVALPNRGHRDESRLEARIELVVPGAVLICKSTSADPRMAVRRAFKSSRRRLEDFVRAQRGAVKAHTAEARSPRVRRQTPRSEEVDGSAEAARPAARRTSTRMALRRSNSRA